MTPLSTFLRRSIEAAARVVLLALCAPLFNVALAQTPVPAAVSTPPANSTAAILTAEIPSPRSTFERYLVAIGQWRANRRSEDLESAKSCFDTRGYTGVEASYAAERWSQYLIDVLDRVQRIELDHVADAAAVANLTSYTLRIENPDHAGVAFEIQFVKVDDGRWLFSRQTGEHTVEWSRTTDGWKTISGLDKHRSLAERVRSTVPASLQRTAFWLEHWQWIGLGLLILVGVFLQPVVSLAFRRIADSMGRAERIKLDRKLLSRFERPLTIVITSIVFARGLYLLDLEPTAFNVLHIAASLVITVSVGWAAYRLVDVICQFLAERAALTESKFDDMLVPLLRRTLKILVILFGVAYLLTQISENVWQIVAGLSIGTLAIGFAAKDSIENLFGTFTVLLDKPFQLGDVIKVGDVEGTVEDVGFRSTRVRTGEDSLITVPNSRFISANVDNLGARRHRRIRAMLSLTYDTPPEKIEAFCEGVRECIRRNPNARQDNFEVSIFQLSASSIDVLMQFYVLAPGFRDDVRERHTIYTFVLQLAKRLNVGLAFPTTAIHVVDPHELTHPDAPANFQAAREVGRDAAAELVRTEQPSPKA